MNEETNEKERLDWHSGFDAGLRLSMRKYADDLKIEREHSLSDQPLRIDYLVLRKSSLTKIDNDLGRDFRGHNIIEYKNPSDELNIDVLWKVISYAGLYKSFGKHIDEIKIEDITITIVRSRKPSKLFNQLIKSEKIIKEKYPGVYSIVGLVDIPINIVVLREVRDKELLALQVMDYNASEAAVRKFLQEVSKYDEACDKRNADAVLQISAGANKSLYERLRGDKEMCEALKEIMAEDLKEAESKGEKRGIERGIEKGIEKGIEQRDEEKIEDMLKRGKTPEEIVEFCNYPIEQVNGVLLKIQDDE
ncbi:MAG: hypothetical protein J6N21_23745 [Butyrivibrio sp.]|nr:hypothetical protein [Butyrivibrio sp.]